MLNLQRYDHSSDRSLRPYSAADELLLTTWRGNNEPPMLTALYLDRFGFLACHLHEAKTVQVVTHKSQEQAIAANLKANQLSEAHYTTLPDPLENAADVALIKAPKSLGLFELFLQHVHQNSTAEITVHIGFMTRHFTPRLLEISGKYFEELQQSRAVKKARILTLRKKRSLEPVAPIDVLTYEGEEYQQYWGVFSRKQIDYATQFLIENLEVSPSDNVVLDLAAGNGVIGKQVLAQNPAAILHLLDDAYLAVASARLNVTGQNVHHHCAHELTSFADETFDLIVTNPPFHFEYEVNIDVAIQLFRDCKRCLKPSGNLQLVANTHLNYKTHLSKIFGEVRVVAENAKYVVYWCGK